MSLPLIVLSFWMQFGPLAAAAKPAEEAKNPVAEPSQPKGPQPIGVSDIADRLLQSARVVRESLAHAVPLNRVVDIERELPRFSTAAKEFVVQTRSVLATAPARGAISDLSAAWGIFQRRLDGWQSILKDRSGALQRDFEALRRDSESWHLTRSTAGEQQLPAEVVARIDQTIGEIDKAQQAVLARRNAVLTLQDQVAALRVEVDQATEALSAVAGAQRGELLQRDSPPIWRAVRLPGPKPSVVAGKAESPAPSSDALAYYSGTVVLGFLLHLLVFCVVLAGMLLLRRRGAAWIQDEDASIRAVGVVAKRPASAALLLTILGGVLLPWQAPEFVTELAGYLMLFPLLRLIPRMIPSELKPLLWLLAGLFVGSNSLSMLPESSIAIRFLVLAMSATAAGGLYWLERRFRAAGPASGWLKTARAGIWIAVALLAVAFAGEMLGATQLSGMLMNGVLDSVYVAVLLYGATLILQGFMRIVLRSRRLESALSLDEGAAELMARFSKGLNYFGFAVFLALSAGFFGLSAPLAGAARAALAHEIGVGAFQFSLGAAVTFGLVLLAAFVASRIVRFFLSASVYGRIDLQRGSAESISKILHYAMVLSGFLLALGAAGIDLSRFTVLAGAFGVGLAFGMQNIVNNFVSGLILLFERPLHVGDRITIGATSGEVADIGIRASTIRTWDGADVIMPNGTLISNEVTNWTLSDSHRRCELRVGVAYGTDPDLVIRVLNETIVKHPLVRQEPAATVHLSGFGASSIDFIARFWAHVDHHVDVTSEIHIEVVRRLAKEGIEIPFPQRDLNLRTIDAAVAEALRAKPRDPAG